MSEEQAIIADLERAVRDACPICHRIHQRDGRPMSRPVQYHATKILKKAGWDDAHIARALKLKPSTVSRWQP